MIDLIDLVRSIAAAADRAAENKNYPAPCGQGSPLLDSVRQACVERGYTAGGLAVSAVAPRLVVDELPPLMSSRWLGADFWEQQGLRPALTLGDLLARSEVVTVGIDGGGLDDLLGLAVIGRERETRRWLLWTRAWAHPSVMERRKSEAVRFEDFAKQGDLVLLKRIGEDVEQVAAAVLQVEQSGLLDKVGCDSAGIGAILDAMVEAGVPQEKIVAISQGWRLGGAIKTTERKLAEGVIEHGGQPMMAWCVGNAKVEPRGNAILITKQASGSAKIDPLMAVFDAVSLMELNPPAQGGSVYESRAIAAKAAS